MPAAAGHSNGHLSGRGGRFPAKRQLIDGEQFASKIEAERYGELKLLQRAGQIEGLRLHPEFTVDLCGQPFCTYTADFSFYEVDGSERNRVIEEIKSSGTAKDAAYKLRRKAAEIYYGFRVTEIIK